MALILDGSQQLSLQTPPYVISTGLAVVFCAQPESETSSFYVLGDYRDSSSKAGKSICLYGTPYGHGNRPHYLNVAGGNSGAGTESYTSPFPQVPQLISYSWVPVDGRSFHTARASAVFDTGVFQSINGLVWSTNWTPNFSNGQDKLYLFDKYDGGGVAFRGKVFWVAIVNEFWDNTKSSAIHEALLRQDTYILDTYQNSLIELWDFNEGHNALTGLIAGTRLAIEKGTLSYQSSNVPISRNAFMGIGQPNIFSAPAWLSTLDIPAAGSETINCSPAALTLTATAAALQASSALAANPDAITLSPVSASIRETVAVLANPATISLSGVNAAINLSGQIQIDAIPATITLAANSATFAQHAVVNTQPDALVLQPVMAGLYAGEAVVDAVAKALTLAPGQATIVQHGVLATTPDNIALHGSKAGLHTTNIIAANTASAILYGTPAWLHSTEIVSGKPASITLQGNQALIRSDGVGVVDTWPDSIGIFGQKADISMRTMLATNPASMVLASMRAQINYESPFVWGSMTIEARLQSMTIEARQ